MFKMTKMCLDTLHVLGAENYTRLDFSWRLDI